MTRACMLWTALALAAPSVDDRSANEDLARGIRLVEDGDFETALLSLDAAARALSRPPGTAKDLAAAYLYLGLAYVGLKQEALARTRFEQALAQDPTLRLDPDEFPPAALRVFAAAELEKKALTKKGKSGAIVLGAGAAVAGGIALVAASKRSPGPPFILSIYGQPEGQPIVGVTVVSFSANIQNPSGGSLTYEWFFSDNQSSSGAGPTPLATGATAQHIFGADGTFEVVLAVSDGLSSDRRAIDVVSRSLTGQWQSTPGLFLETEFQLQQVGPLASGSVSIGASSSPLT
jgi:hypothetical protein